MRVTYFAQTFNKQICNKTNADSCLLSQSDTLAHDARHSRCRTSHLSS